MKYLIVTVMLAFEGIINVHQEQYFKPPWRSRPIRGVVYPEITRRNADDSLLNCAKFFLNYAFYKFGLEVSALLGTGGVYKAGCIYA